MSLVFLTACGGGSASPDSVAQVPSIALSTSSLDFGAQPVGTPSVPLVLTITNSGNGDLTLGGVAIAGTSASVFSLAGNNCGSSVSAGSSCAVKVSFTPGSTSSMTATLTISDNVSNKTVGLSGSGFTVTGLAHGVFMLDPPVDDTSCAPEHPANCYSQHLVPTFICSGNGTPVGYNCTQAGAGEPYVKGAHFQIRWDMVNPANGTYDFSKLDGWMQTWNDAGKLSSIDFEPTAYGTMNGYTPSWYVTPANISSVSQTGGIITVQTSSPMGFFPGGISAAPGLEIQIAGTGTALDGNGTAASSGIWTVCDHNTAGCQDPSSQTIYAIGAGADISAASAGTVGNPLYGSDDGSTCTSGIVPIQWRPNFIKAWQMLMQQVVAHYGTNPNVANLRFGMGSGGQTNPTNGLSAGDPNRAACQAQMTTYGFTSVAAPWPDPGTSQWPQVAANWIAYLKMMLQFEQTLHSPKVITIDTSPIQFSPDDFVTPDATAANAVAAHIGFGNLGVQKTDASNFAAGIPCGGGDWCANFQKYRGQVPLELETLFYSDPTNASQTGSLVTIVPFATAMGVQILELYLDDLMCTYDTTWVGNNTYAVCNAAGYPAVVSAAAAHLN